MVRKLDTQFEPKIELKIEPIPYEKIYSFSWQEISRKTVEVVTERVEGGTFLIARYHEERKDFIIGKR
jgi:hypothetical protein